MLSKLTKTRLEREEIPFRPYFAISKFKDHGKEDFGCGVMIYLKNIGNGPARLHLDIEKEGEINRADLDTPLAVGIGGFARVKVWLPDSIYSPNGAKFCIISRK